MGLPIVRPLFRLQADMKLVRNNRFAFVTSMLLALTGLVTLVAMLPAPGVSATTAYRGRILVTTTSTGTGTLTQLTTFTGYSAPAATDDGKTFEISIVAVDGSGNPTGDFEECESVYTHSGTTWSRGRLIRSSTGSRVSFAAGTKRIAVIASESTFAKIGNFIDVANAATGGSGTLADPWTGWDTAITWAANTQYRFRTGYYSYATSPNFLLAGISLIGEEGAILKHTGSGNAFVMDAGATWLSAARVENLIIQGNANTTNAMYLNGVRFCQFANIRIRGCSGAGLYSKRCVTNTFINYTCSYIELLPGTFTVTPTNGIVLTEGTTTWSFINPVIEGVSGDGVWIKTTTGQPCTFNVFDCGTCEVNGGFGVRIDLGHSFNTFIGMDFESNGGVRSSAWGAGTNNGDIYDVGINNWISCLSFGFTETYSNSTFNTCSFSDVKDFLSATFIGCLRSGTAVYAFSSRRINCRDASRIVDPDVQFASGLNWNQFSPSSGGTHTPDSQTYPGQRIILPAGNITVASPTGGTVMFQKLLLQVVQDSGGSRTITWGSGFTGTIPQPTATASTATMYEFAYNIFTSKWDLLYSH
jgi:hypothetical protein